LEEEFTKILKASELDLPLAPEKIASLLVINFEGVIMKTKLEKNWDSITLFNEYIFECLLKPKES